MNKKYVKLTLAAGVLFLLVAVFIILIPPLTTPYSDEPQAFAADAIYKESQLPPIEARARQGDVDAMTDLVGFYQSSLGPDHDQFDLINGQNDASRKARYWADMAVKAGDQSTIFDYVLDHNERAMNQSLSPEVRRYHAYRAFEYYFLLRDSQSREGATDNLRETIAALKELDK